MKPANIRLRFAPSPTGYLHVGGLRTALYNYLFAKNNNGQLILRIEDTDQKRLVKDSVKNIVDVLKWAGIDFDEGPHTKIGTMGPYTQSQRLDIYKECVIKLIKKKHAYVCFYSDDRLKKIEESEIAKESAAEYDKKYKDSDIDQSLNRMEHENCVIRLSMPSQGELIINDLIKKKLKFDYSLIEDPIIIKSDGFPTYHFASVVDDHYMMISHVIRGEEWLSSLPKHIHLYNCFEWKIPEFAHLPLLLNHDKSKLSKRQGDVAVEDYINKGYLKEALINFIALLGWHDSNDKEFYSLPELQSAFSLDRVQSSGAIFNIKKLNWLNQHYIKNLNSKEVLNLAAPYLPSSWKINLNMIDLVKDKLSKISDIKAEILPFFEKPSIDHDTLLLKFPDIDLKKIIPIVIESLKKEASINKEILNKVMNQISSETDYKGKQLWQPIRFILTGAEHGPDLSIFMSIIGLDECLQRFSDAL